MAAKPIDVRCELGHPIGTYPESIALLLSEDELVRLMAICRAHGDDSIAKKIRAYQLAAFARWHG
jgi:hypothetical protein